MDEDKYQFETMQGGGSFIQFFCLTGGRIEVALRVGTAQTFNPNSVQKFPRTKSAPIRRIKPHK